jgi:hypothetical protein
LPRTPLPKSSRRYSGRISSLALLIYTSLMSSCPTGADDSDCSAPLCVHHRKQSARLRETKRQEPLLPNRMIRVVESVCQRVQEYRCCLFKWHAVLANVRRRLDLIPFKSLRHGYPDASRERPRQAAPEASGLGDQFDRNSGDFRMKLDA